MVVAQEKLDVSLGKADAYSLVEITQMAEGGISGFYILTEMGRQKGKASTRGNSERTFWGDRMLSTYTSAFRPMEETA